MEAFVKQTSIIYKQQTYINASKQKHKSMQIQVDPYKANWAATSLQLGTDGGRQMNNAFFQNVDPITVHWCSCLGV